MIKTYWLAELNEYGVPKLEDGPHNTKDGAEEAMILFDRLGFSRGKKFGIAEVIVTSPEGYKGEINEEAIQALNSIGIK